jgi:hypothetical protein
MFTTDVVFTITKTDERTGRREDSLHARVRAQDERSYKEERSATTAILRSGGRRTGRTGQQYRRQGSGKRAEATLRGRVARAAAKEGGCAVVGAHSTSPDMWPGHRR